MIAKISFEVALDHTGDFAVDLHAVCDKHVDNRCFVLLVLFGECLKVDTLVASASLVNAFFNLKSVNRLELPQQVCVRIPSPERGGRI